MSSITLSVWRNEDGIKWTISDSFLFRHLEVGSAKTKTKMFWHKKWCEGILALGRSKWNKAIEFEEFGSQKNKFLVDWAWRNFWLDAKFFQCHAKSGKWTINRIEISDKSILILVNYYLLLLRKNLKSFIFVAQKFKFSSWLRFSLERVLGEYFLCSKVLVQQKMATTMKIHFKFLVAN